MLMPMLSFASQDFNLTVQEPWFSDIKNGTKSVEGRLDRGVFSQIKAGDQILWNGACLVRVTFVDHYTSIVQMLVEEGLKHVLPGVTSFEKAVAIYNAFYPGQTSNVSALGIGMELVQR
jgi:ASC-1-like (ASCH) protein